MRTGPHWNDYPPDDPPEPERWCDRCGATEGQDCDCPPEETNQASDSDN